MQTQQIKVLILSLIVLITFSLFLVGISSGFLGELINTAPTSTEDLSLHALAPKPLSPPDHLEFVDSDVLLQWEWPQTLAAEQVFAVRIWYEDESPIEVWTEETTISAQEYIDSLSRDLGAFHWQVAVINYSSQDGFESMGSEWSPLQTLNRVRRFVPTPYPVSQQSDLARFIAEQQLPLRTEVIDYARHYIYANSASDYQEPGDPDRRDALDAMLRYSQGNDEIPHLLCDGRATAMLTLLQELGIESRLVFLYRDNGDSIQEHTILEVFNPDTQRWEVQDPYRDVYYLDVESQERSSVERLVFGALDNIVVCDEAACRQDQEDSDAMGYFAVFRYGWSNTFLVNPDRFSVSKRFPDHDDANLPEYLSSKPRELIFQFDAWQN
ncbi:MAG: transglutaminase domain-containing protein [Anaerolineae bacterium]|nr:transglutaminase domain-containing protein [Anaerolineae bacterium]